MKLKKTFNKLSKEEQESHLVSLLTGIHEEERQIRKMLATIRGGKRVEVEDKDERVDELNLKYAK
jgi:hypothetical protein